MSERHVTADIDNSSDKASVDIRLRPPPTSAALCRVSFSIRFLHRLVVTGHYVQK